MCLSLKLSVLFARFYIFRLYLTFDRHGSGRRRIMEGNTKRERVKRGLTRGRRRLYATRKEFEI